MSPTKAAMKLLLTLTFFIVAAQASHLIPLDVEVPTNPQLTARKWERVMAAQMPKPENYPDYKSGSVPQSPLTGWTAVGNFKSRIIGGDQARRGQFPWQVAVRMGDQSLCGGSILSKSWILTAGHCVSGFNKFTLILGAVDITSPGLGSHTAQVRESIIHELYEATPLEADIALFKLPDPIQFSTYMSPVKLPAHSFYTSLTNVPLRVSGWGLTTIDGSSSTTLNFVDVNGISNEDCAEKYGAIITNRNICTLGVNGKTACNGDDGGPLVYQLSSGRYTQVGIVSFGHEDGCSLAPIGYTRVTSYLKWIETKAGIAIEK